MSRYDVLLDFPNSVLYLRPGKNFDRPELFDLSGLLLSKGRKEVRVGAVAIGSAAANAGIEKGNVLFEIDGVKTSDLSLSAIRRRLCIEGRHELVVRRGNTETRIGLELSRNKRAQREKGVRSEKRCQDPITKLVPDTFS